MDDNVKIFLSELKELCKKHDAHIYGCGCCGSPGVKIGKAVLTDLDCKKDMVSAKKDKHTDQEEKIEI